MKSLGRQSLSQRLHLDVPLCFGLLMLCGLGLVVLYSASGEDLSIVTGRLREWRSLSYLCFWLRNYPQLS